MCIRDSFNPEANTQLGDSEICDYLDSCGECGGSDTSCSNVELSYNNSYQGSFLMNEQGSIEVLYSSAVNVHGFQFNISGVILTGASSDIGDVSINSSTGNIVGLSFTGNILPAGTGTLVTLYFDPNTNDTELCMTNEILSTDDGIQIESQGAGCMSILAGIQASLSYGEITGGSLADGSDGTIEILYSSICLLYTSDAADE